MDDQFGGRTDDDLFSDDFEPLTNAVTEVPPSLAPVTAPALAAPPTEAVEIPAGKPERSSAPAPNKAKPAVKGLAYSKYSDKPAPRPPRQPAANSPSNASKPSTHQKPATNPPAASQPTASQEAPNQEATSPSPAAQQGGTSNDTAPPPSAPTGPSAGPNAPRAGKKTSGAALPGQNTALKSESRIKSGANPRTKLTEGELTERLEKMAILSAEKARKHELSEADERTHAAAYAHGMEEAKKKKAAEAERRKRGEEERRRMDAERAKNRERKLKAMENKTGGWDQGKIEEQEQDREFRGAHGGIRGARGADSLAGSRYARNNVDQGAGDLAGDENYRGRGRGRGRGGSNRGRGGRGGNLNGRDGAGASASTPFQATNKPVLNTADFPALPSVDSKFSPDSPTGPLDWGEEMESLDAKLAGKDQ
ncbi:hypothetical protein VD0004_g2124 [Verticillium dahliae]|uniref:Uncharacterized protein n=1 Tax=Verticillium dahliae TaxID=27337 RepID=A0A444RTR1_VERDA|nr:hypothetical protein VD0004_g2124 [Verticillium dahliae]PNH75110.1 hypothetical protein VD0001_g2442 [Verticillium dahliae]RXG44542.1 hypothetical protein VDGE_05302 [Verticillium dahliae]